MYQNSIAVWTIPPHTHIHRLAHIYRLGAAQYVKHLMSGELVPYGSPREREVGWGRIATGKVAGVYPRRFGHEG